MSNAFSMTKADAQKLSDMFNEMATDAEIQEWDTDTLIHEIRMCALYFQDYAFDPSNQEVHYA